jgi:hypothetical protein
MICRSGIIKAHGYSGITPGVIVFRSAFSEAILAGSAITTTGNTSAATVPALAGGFHAAFLLAMAISMPAAFFAWKAEDAVPVNG